MASIDQLYKSLLKGINDVGYTYMDESRNVSVKQLSHATLSHDMIDGGFPLLTLKKMWTRGIVSELLWFLRGSSDVRQLHKDKNHIWDKDWQNYHIRKHGLTVEDTAAGEGNIADLTDYSVGRNYGVQWRSWQGFQETSKYLEMNEEAELMILHHQDQISDLIVNMIRRPMSRRHIVTAWNPSEINQTALPPCHWAFEIIMRPMDHEGKRSGYGFVLKWHQRSVDTFLGLPFNIASYALLAEILEELTGAVCLEIIGDLSNIHIYEPHTNAVTEILSRGHHLSSPTLTFSANFDQAVNRYKMDNDFNTFINSIGVEDIIFNDYQPLPAISADMIAPKQ